MISLILEGAHVTIFARRKGPLEAARAATAASALNTEQDIISITIDMADSSQVPRNLPIYKSGPAGHLQS